MTNETFNREFDEIIGSGSDGNQAYKALFIMDRQGRYMRITQAEGNELALNPETEERNPIGQKSASTVVRRYQIQFGKDIFIAKDDPEYEFFYWFYKKKYTGANAKVPMMIADFMKNIPNTKGKQNYEAYSFNATVTVDTYNATDARLVVNFGQAGEITEGIASSENFDDVNKYPEFVASTNIPIDTITLSAETTSLVPSEEKWVAVDFEPLGCPDGFTAESSAPAICTAVVRRSSVVITAVGVGTADVTVTSTADSAKSASIAVTVATVDTGGGGTQGISTIAKTSAKTSKEADVENKPY